jgi:hypothetical protein
MKLEFHITATRLDFAPANAQEDLYSGSPEVAALVIQISEGFVRFEVFTAVTMKNVVFWDIKTQFVFHRRHITSPLESPAG